MIYVWCGKLHKQTANEYVLCSCNFLKGGFRQCFKMHACMIYCIFRHKIGLWPNSPASLTDVYDDLTDNIFVNL